MASSSSFSSSSSFLLLGLFLLLINPSSSLTTTCSSQKFTKNRLYDFCNDLPQLTSYLHWSYDRSKGSLSLAFIGPPVADGGWVAWGINPTVLKMVGTQTLIGFRQSNGTMTVKSYNVSAYGPQDWGDIGMEVSDLEGEYSGGLMTIYATVVLPGNKTTVNQVWQVGSEVKDSIPQKHAFQTANLNSMGTIDLLKGESSTSSGGGSKIRKRNIHGVLNAVSWGILMPLGAMIARYMRSFESADPAWFYVHVGCQVSAYIVGVAGWGTGLKLGSESKGVTYTAHRNIGIALFCLGTLQVFALLLRPKKDHKYRIYWNFYHHSVGYTVIVLSIINVIKGLHILDPQDKWWKTYISIISVLGVIAVFLEAITWIVVLKRKSKNSTKLFDGSNGRTQHHV